MRGVWRWFQPPCLLPNLPYFPSEANSPPSVVPGEFKALLPYRRAMDLGTGPIEPRKTLLLPPRPACSQDPWNGCRNTVHFEHQGREPNRQSNRRSRTDTYIPDNSWPRTRRQYTLDDVWVPRPDRALNSSSKPSSSQQNDSTNAVDHPQ